jgi:hypothetical protein
LEIYENSPDEYVQKLHKWFTAEQAEEGRAKAKKYWATMYHLKVTFRSKH